MNIPFPTVRAAKDFDIDKDVANLRKAMKGLGTDEQALIDILTARSNSQRQKIKEHYNATLNRNLMKDLNSELSGYFYQIIKALMRTPVEYICKNINKALKGIYAIDQILVESLFTKSKEEVHEIIEYYQRAYEGHILSDEIRTRVLSAYRPILSLIAQGVRNSDQTVDKAKAKKQAAELYAAGKGVFTYKHEIFHRTLAQESFPQLREIFKQYNDLADHTVQEAIQHGGLDGYQCFLLTLVECVQSPPAFFATRLFKAMDGAGTDDTTLIRIIVSRSEIDLGNIKEEFERLYNRTLVSAVKSETSGDYKRALCALIGGA